MPVVLVVTDRSRKATYYKDTEAADFRKLAYAAPGNLQA
jgi:hypothetical protein